MPVKGSQKKQHLTSDEILQRTSGGYDIFMYYLGRVQRSMKRPAGWGKKDKDASWGIYPYNDIWFWKDFASEDSGTAIQFVERHFGLTFKEARDKICWDFGFGGTEVNAKPAIITWTAPEGEEREEYVHIGVTTKPFTKRHHEFWNAAEVTEEWCKKFNCFAVKDLAVKRRKVAIKPNEIVFVYKALDIESYKIYFPERGGDFGKFRNNVPYRYLWNYDNVKECDDLIVCKSNKDMIVTAMLTDCVIATQNESIKIFNEEVVGKINKISKTPWMWYGSDPDGVKKCIAITGTNQWRYINTPKNLLPEINDQYGYVKQFGLKGLEEFMKLKKLLK